MAPIKPLKQDDEMKQRGLYRPFVIMWAALSMMMMVLGFGFAGGVKEAFSLPDGGDHLSIAAWAVSWLFILFPFMWLLSDLLKYLRR